MNEPICGWKWLKEHENDHKDFVPRIEISRPGSKIAFSVRDDKAMKEAVKVIREGR